MNAQRKPSPLEKAQAEQQQYEDTVRRWLADKAKSESGLADRLETAGDVILADPETADRLGLEIAQFRARLSMADRAIAEAAKRHRAAGRAVLLAEADELEKPIRLAEVAVEDHRKRTEELLRPLEEHTRQEWRPLTIDDLSALDGPRSILTPIETTLRGAVADLMDQRDQLIASAEQVPPLDLVDADLVRASIRLLEVDGTISPGSSANVAKCATALRREADELEHERGQQIYQLKEAHGFGWTEAESAQRVDLSDTALEAWLLDGWQVPTPELEAVRDEALRLGQRQAAMRAEASIWDAALASGERVAA